MSTLEDYGELLLPEEAMEPILARPVRNALTEWLEEIWAEKELAEVDLKPRRKALFDGPPGVGKTTLAHHLSARLGLPMLAVRPDRIQSEYFARTSHAIGALFDLVRRENDPIMLFFDEMESLASKRLASDGTGRGHREDFNLAVNTFLTRLDAFDGFVIGATNVGKDIDYAVWRRFEVQITLALPGQEERERIVARYLAPYMLPKRPLAELAVSLETATPALIRQFCETVKRQLVVGPRVGWNMGREAVLDRVLAAISPHPDLGKPRLWTLGGSKDPAVKTLPWPLSTKIDADSDLSALDGEAAEALGGDAFREGAAIVKNPFPFADPRRARWDKGWRAAAGSDGMGDADKVVVLRKP